MDDRGQKTEGVICDLLLTIYDCVVEIATAFAGLAMTGCRGWMTEDRRQKTEGRRQRAGLIGFGVKYYD